MRVPRVAFLLLAACAARAHAGDGQRAAPYFPLHAGNWWAYEEIDEDGTRLSRENWTVVGDAAGEFQLRASTKRLDLLGRNGRRRWEGEEFLRTTPDGVHKRYPAGRDAAVDVLVLNDPVGAGGRWHDAQGDCESSVRGGCEGPGGELADCAIVVCRLGTPTATVVTSTYARGVGMVRQEVEVVQFLPALPGAAAMLPCDAAKGGRSVLRLTRFHVAPR
jgi:hypothetical protein